MLRKIIFVGFILFTSGCKPVAENSAVNIKNAPALQCIKSQSQCEVTTELASFSLKFSQQQLSDNVKTELPFFIELSLFETKVDKSTEQSIAQSKAQNTPPSIPTGIHKNITKVSAYLEGKEMFMGKVPVFFEQGTHDVFIWHKVCWQAVAKNRWFGVYG